MKRADIVELVRWKSSSHRKPLIISGARQVGKTWLMKHFGAQEYEKMAYINFESDSTLKNIFSGDFDIQRILLAIRIATGVNAEPGNTLIVLDEIQEAPGALTSLKYFYENAPEYHVMSAGSLLGVALHKQASFPVGKVDFLHLYPLSFREFLEAVGEAPLTELLDNGDWNLISAFMNRYRELLRQYYYIGGMPEAVASFRETSDFTLARSIQKRILMAYEQDFSKHAPYSEVPRLRALWNAIPGQLAKENRKFIFGALKQGARAREYEMAISWLVDCGLAYQINRVNKPAVPLKAYEDLSAFKLFMLDVGLLGAMVDLDVKTLLEGNSIFEEFKGSITEQYVLQQLVTMKDMPVYYWSAPKATAEIDFLIQYEGKIIPLEVKAEENLKAKSLKSFCEKYKPSIAIRTSMSGFRKEEWLINLPLYGISRLPEVVTKEAQEKG